MIEQPSRSQKTSVSALPATRRFKHTALALSVGLALVGGVAMTAYAQSPAPATPANAQMAALPSFSGVVRQVLPAVVNVKVTEEKSGQPVIIERGDGMPQEMPMPEFFRHFFEEMPQQMAPEKVQAQGSGFLIDADGHIVTNNHVVDGATDVTVSLNDGTSYPARVVGTDRKTDLALLEIDAGKPLPYVSFGDSDKIDVGDWVLAVGNPFGLGGSVNAGIISARGRDIHSGPYDDYLQTDAAINRGNSGGPLFNAAGQVIGVNTAIFSPNGGNIGIGFAIPSDTVQQVVQDLQKHGHVDRGWIGVHIQQVTPQLAGALGLKDAKGVLVADVLDNGPAASTDLHAGDVIVKANGREITDYRDLPRMVAGMKAGSDLHLAVMRDGKMHAVTIKVGRMPADTDQDANASSGNDMQNGSGHLGLYVQALTPQLRREQGIPASVQGVIVTRVMPGSPAARVGIEPGSVISMVGSRPIQSPGELQQAVQDAVKEHRNAIILRVEQQGTALFVAIPLDS